MLPAFARVVHESVGEQHGMLLCQDLRMSGAGMAPEDRCGSDVLQKIAVAVENSRVHGCVYHGVK